MNDSSSISSPTAALIASIWSNVISRASTTRFAPSALYTRRGFAVRRARLCAYVNIQSRRLPRNPRDCAKVGDDRRIHTHVARRLRRAHHAVKVAVKGKNVERQIDLSARRMRQRNSLLKLLFVKIPCLCAQAVLFRATINGASAPKRSAV